ncbi:hypothetical protein CROQUDRAFT_9346, partial [Cronartium quercuum f. sp. fusiforme G11]
KFQMSTKLTDPNYKAWKQPILEAFMMIDYDGYLLKTNYKSSILSDELHIRTKFLITTYILKSCDYTNEAMSCAVLKEGTGIDDTMNYDPHTLWDYLKTRHRTITEGKLRVIDKVLH